MRQVLGSFLEMQIRSLGLLFACITVCIGQYTPNPPPISPEDVKRALTKMASLSSVFKVRSGYTKCFPKHVVPYTILPGFTQEEIDNIMKHIRIIESKTCLRWVEKNVTVSRAEGFRKHVHFKFTRVPASKTQDTLCYEFEAGDPISGWISYVYLGDYCFEDEAVPHEIMHSLGFIHEHQRLDRDCYITLNEEDTTKPDVKIIYDDYFEKWPYDKFSITHYHEGQYGMKARDDTFPSWLYNSRLGDEYDGVFYGDPQGKLSDLDVMKINYRYCGAPDYCELNKAECDNMEKVENALACKLVYQLALIG